MKKKFYITVFIALNILIHNACAQLHYSFETLTEKNGLSDNRVSSILKDRKGFMWFGTRNGLNRYDGSTFKIFRPGIKNSISNEIVNDLAEDSSGNIWVATMEGLNEYQPAKNTWQTIMPSPEGSPRTLPNFLVWSIYADKNNLLWIASDVNEFASYNIATKKFTHYNWQAYVQQAFPGMKKTYRSIQKFKPKSDHEFWIGSNIGLFTFDINTGSFHFIGCDFDADITDLAYDTLTRCVYLSTQDNHIFSYNEASGKYQGVSLIAQPYPSNTFIENYNRNNHLWIPSSTGIADIKNENTAAVLQHIPRFSSSLLPGTVNAIYRDNNNIEWIATSNGISKLDINTASAFLPLVTADDLDAANKMGPVIYDEQDNKYFVCCHSSGQLFIVDVLHGNLQTVNAIGGDRLNGCIAIRIDQGKNIWLLTENHAYLYNRNKNEFELFRTPNGNSEVTFRDVVRDANGNYWFALFNSGLYYYDVKQKKFTDPPVDNSFFPDIVSCLLSDTIHRTVWVGTYAHGVFRYDLDKRKITNFIESKQNPEYLQLNLINDMYQDLNGRIWMATYSGGIYVYESGKSYETCFRHFTMKNGLSNNGYFSVTGNAGKIWLLSGKGITELDTAGHFIEDLGKEKLMSLANYISDTRYPHYMFYDQSKKELLLAAGGGIIFLSPSRKTTITSFPLMITDVSVNNHSLLDDSSFSIMQEASFPYSNNSIAVDFAGLRYADNTAIQYEYQLSGDHNWIPVGVQHNIKFNNLQPGSYTLKIRSKDTDGRLNDSTATFSFKIIPPFWRSWWFITAIAILVLYILYRWNYSLREKIRSEKILNYFATSLYGHNTIEDVFWDIAKNCMSQLNFEDCVIYLYDAERKTLVQKAAYGAKNPVRFEILNNIEIPSGKGIVGSVAQSGKASIINDTSRDARYIIDDEKRLSEITVPIMIDGKLFGIIDSEHHRKNFYKKRDLRLLKKIADITGTKISKYLIEERLRSKIARDLHDELGSNLTSINIISKVALQQNDNQQVSLQLNKIKEHSGKMMESMSDIVWAINPANDTAEKMMLRMKEHTAEMLEPLKIGFYFYEEGALPETKLGLNERKDIFLIFKEVLNNAVKYSGATEINIWLKKEAGSFVLIITDNGVGFNINKVTRGNGLSNIKSRAAAMNAQLIIKAIPGNGTSISLELPLT
ncbi:MAG: two-component regulator propeller domain-containing protein [Ferruginibacter sp.]